MVHEKYHSLIAYGIYIYMATQCQTLAPKMYINHPEMVLGLWHWVAHPRIGPSRTEWLDPGTKLTKLSNYPILSMRNSPSHGHHRGTMDGRNHAPADDQNPIIIYYNPIIYSVS